MPHNYYDFVPYIVREYKAPYLLTKRKYTCVKGVNAVLRYRRT